MGWQGTLFAAPRPMAVTVSLFVAGICLGIAGALTWAWAVHSGQFRDLERTKDQLFWPELADESRDAPAAAPAGDKTR
jgi:cbb3-type cytochrome oxidase maturation protein